MADRPPYSSNPSEASVGGDPFAERQQHLTFQEPRPHSAYASTISLPEEFGGPGEYNEDDESEKVPLTSGGMYPPG